VTHAELWERLPDAVVAGGPTAGWDRPDTASRYYPSGVCSLAELSRPAACRAAELLVGEGIVPRSVLDVGAGAAPWSLAISARAAGCTVTALDLAPVLKATRSAASAARREAQFRYLAGDMFDVELGGPYDLVLLGNVCHLFSEGRNLRLLRRIRRAVERGGRLAIADVLPAARPDLARRLALYELSLVLRTEHGAVYSFSSYAAWLRAAGFAEIEQMPLGDEQGLTLIVARRR
jgi:SAM-dependent methyltransferase